MLYIVRHGRTATNAVGRLLGRSDPPLDDVGRSQAATLAGAIPKPDRVVSSPLVRALETAACFGVDVEVDDRWIELDYGTIEDLPLADVPPTMWDEWRADIGFAPPGGEPLAQLGERVRAACESLAADAARHDVVVVTHVSPIKAAAAWALGVGDEVIWRLFVAPASITRIVVGAYGPVLHSFNEGAHLPM